MPLNQTQIDALIEAVRNTAKQEVVPRFRAPKGVSQDAKAHVFDLVTEADLQCEQALSQRIADILPGAVVVGEEAVEENAGLLDAVAVAETCVVVDPVDGTWNFASGLPIFGLMLAVLERGETVFGLLYDVMTDTWVAAEKGAGTHLCRAGQDTTALKLGQSHDKPLSGFFAPYEFPQDSHATVLGLMLEFGHVTSLRCSCHEYLTLLQGHTDFTVAAHVKPWDHLAGVLAISEAGGRSGLIGLGEFTPAKSKGRLLNVADPARFDEIEALFVKRLGAWL